MCKIVDWVLFLLLAICGYRDIKKREISVYLLIIMSVGVVILAFVCDTPTLPQRITGAIIGSLFFGISKVTKEAIGYGDSWLILILGVHMGGLAMLQVLLLASLLAAVCSLFYLWKRKWKKNATIPFVPFMVLAYLGAMFI